MPIYPPATPEETAAAWQSAVAALSRGRPDGLFQTVAAIRTVKDYLFPAWPLREAAEPAPPEVLQALGIVIEAGRQDGLLEWLQDTMRSQYELVLAEIEKETCKWAEHVPIDQTLGLIGFWSTLFDTWYRPLRILTSGDASAYDMFSRRLATSIIETIPETFPVALRDLFHSHLTSSPILAQPIAGSDETPASRLAKLGLLTKFQPILFSLVYDLIDDHLKAQHAREWADERTSKVLKWLNEDVGGWLVELFVASVHGDGSEEDLQRRRKKAVETLRPAMGRFEYHVYRQTGLLRIAEIFDIIVDFPDSTPALIDLKTCLSRTELRQNVVAKLRSANARRLLHPGADTRDIISQYISMIKALKVLDPPGVLLSRVAGPVRKYLRMREDTIRCIVASLVEPGHALGDELAAEADDMDADLSRRKGIEDGDYLDPNWTPDPVDAPPDYRSGSRRDVVDSLVSIYESRDGFVKELQALLAQRLLAIKDFDAEKELMNVEILKRRFGEAPLQPCDVMLKDIADSKRADTAFKDKAKDSPLRALILSRMFWPNIAPASFKPAPLLAKYHTEFEQVYTTQKADKRLRWVPQLGTVDLEIELEDRTIKVEANMLQASVASLFTSGSDCHVDRISVELGMEYDRQPAKNAVYFWANQGLIKEVKEGIWRVQERLETGGLAPQRHVIEEAPAPSDAAQTEQIQKMRVFWAYIQGMLTNLGTLSLDRIFSTLSTLAQGFRGTTREELRVFLEAMQRERLVEPVGSTEWRLVK